MNLWSFRQKLKSEKSYLQQLQTSQNRKETHKILLNSSSKQIKLIIQFLHLLANGEVIVKKKYRRSFNKQNVLDVFQKYFFFPSTTAQKIFETLLESPKHEMLDVLFKIIDIIPKALFYVFHQQA